MRPNVCSRAARPIAANLGPGCQPSRSASARMVDEDHPRMREERIDIGDVPARWYLPPDPGGVLLLGHGGGQSKDAPRFVHLARRYAEEVGLAVVCIDAVDHGERQAAGATAGVPREWHSSSTERMVQDWEAAADALSWIGPAVAYVGFSMGSIFGVPTVAAIPTIMTAVLVVGGIPTGAWIDDPPLHIVLEEAAGRLEHADVLMLNTADDEIFSAADAQALLDAIRARTKRQRIWNGRHDDWSNDMIEESIDFLIRRPAPPAAGNPTA